MMVARSPTFRAIVVTNEVKRSLLEANLINGINRLSAMASVTTRLSVRRSHQRSYVPQIDFREWFRNDGTRYFGPTNAHGLRELIDLAAGRRTCRSLSMAAASANACNITSSGQLAPVSGIQTGRRSNDRRGRCCSCIKQESLLARLQHEMSSRPSI